MNLLLCVEILLLLALLRTTITPENDAPRPDWDWPTATPESQGLDPARLESLWNDLQQRHTDALLVIRNDRIVFERYASGFSRTTPHGTASLAKALVGGVSLMVAMQDRRRRSRRSAA